MVATPRPLTYDDLLDMTDDAVPPDADGWLTSPTLVGLRVNPAEIFAGLD